MKTDHQLKIDVTEELAWEPSISADHIGVAVEDGIVTLSGHVEHYSQKREAERAVSRVKGVKGLAEAIEVRLPSHIKKGDDELVKAALNRLSWDSAIPKDAIRVKAEKGWLTLSGEVKWKFLKDSAAREVRTLMGVTGVSNEITVKTNPNTATISADIRKALHRTWLSDANVKVTATDGKVRLTGHVPTWADRALAARTAWSAEGTTAVQNDISVA